MKATKTTPQSILEAARHEATQAPSWADFCNYLYAPRTGIISKAFLTRAARSRFLKTKEYKEIRKLIEEVQERTGLIEGAKPVKSGRLLVRLPPSLHAELELEAFREGVSLNQWVVTQLAYRMGVLAGPTMKSAT